MATNENKWNTSDKYGFTPNYIPVCKATSKLDGLTYFIMKGIYGISYQGKYFLKREGSACNSVKMDNISTAKSDARAYGIYGGWVDATDKDKEESYCNQRKSYLHWKLMNELITEEEYKKAIQGK